MADAPAGYQLGPLLGEGGMSEVHAATGPEGQTVALKRLRSPEHADRLMIEAQALQALQGRGVPTVIDLLETESGPILVLERLHGEALDAVLARSRLPLARIQAVFLEVLAVLGRAHEQGWAHRDVKPANIFVRDDGTAVLLDWGVAKAPDEVEGPSVPGTPGFVPLERVTGEGGSASGQDRYAIGAALLRATAGLRIPDRGTEAHLRALLRASDLPADWQDALLCLLHPDPARRPDSAEACRSLLAGLSDHVLASQPTSTVLDVSPPPAAPPERGSRTALWATGVGLLGVLGWIVTAVWFQRAPGPSYPDACRDSAAVLISRQRPDGGFAGTPHAETSAWDTTQQVVALQRAREACDVDAGASVKRGLAHLDTLWRERRRNDHAATLAWATLAGTRSAAEQLRALQNPDGGFGWRAGTPSHPYASVLALLALPKDDPGLEAAAAWVIAERRVATTAGLDEQAFVALHRLERVPAGYAAQVLERIEARCGDASCSLASDGALAAPGRDRVVLQWAPWACVASRLLQDDDLERRCAARLTRVEPSLPSWVVAERVLALASLSRR